MATRDGNDYFKRTTLFWIVSVTVAVGYFSLTVFAPEKVPFGHLGPFGSFSRYLVENHADLMYKGWWAAFAIHVAEAVYALKVCSAQRHRQLDRSLPVVLPDLPVRLRLPRPAPQVRPEAPEKALIPAGGRLQSQKRS